MDSSEITEGFTRVGIDGTAYTPRGVIPTISGAYLIHHLGTDMYYIGTARILNLTTCSIISQLRSGVYGNYALQRMYNDDPRIELYVKPEERMGTLVDLAKGIYIRFIRSGKLLNQMPPRGPSRTTSSNRHLKGAIAA